jgi:hypothetical protein
LRSDAGVGMAGEIGGHDGDSAAKETERAGDHALVLDLDQGRYAGVFRVAKEMQRVMITGAGGEVGVGAAGELFAGAEAEFVAVGVREWGG